jgi:hypothetical protein
MAALSNEGEQQVSSEGKQNFEAVPPNEQIPLPIPNLRPFEAEPLLMVRLHRLNASPLLIAFGASLTALIAVSWTAALSNALYRSPTSPSLHRDIWHFIKLESAGNSGPVPYLRDYPSIILTITITLSVPLVYGLFRSLAVLHQELDEADCIRYDDQGRHALVEAVNKVNARLVRCGRFSPAVLLGLVALVAGLNYRLRGRLFPFIGPGDHYADWWARISPFRLGGLVWVALGAIGLYMVYVEAVVGVNYVKFLRECRVQYHFRANPYNPDGFYGWSRLRRIVSNMEAGVVCSATTVLATFFFLQSSVGVLLGALSLGGFMAVVLYVFIGAMTNLRRQVDADRKAQTAEIIRFMPKETAVRTPEAALMTLAGLARLEMLAKVPAMPIRKGVLLAGALSVIGPLVAITVQLLKYFLP